MEYPDDLLPATQVGLSEFNSLAQDMLDAGHTDDYVKLILGGRVWDEDKETRVFMNALQGCEPARLSNCTLTGDFDSLIGFSPRLPIAVPLSVFPVPNFKFTLKKPIHIEIPLKINGVSLILLVCLFFTLILYMQVVKKVAAHKIANICFATFGTRSQVRAFFPRVSSEDGPPKLSQEDLGCIYDDGILPAIEAVLPEQRAHWPPSYQAAMALSRDSNGHHHFGSIDIPPSSIAPFADALRHNLRGNQHLGVPFFQIELRGTKGMYSFPLTDLEERENTFNRMLDELTLTSERDHLDRWYVDVGMEVVCTDHVVQWVSNSHEGLLKHALPSASEAEVAALHAGSYFSLDSSGHLSDLAGFRCPPHSRGRSDQVVYINLYTTDKAVTYQLHRGAFSTHQPTSLYPGQMPKLLADVGVIAAMFAECGGSKGQTQDGTARLEIRVGMEKALVTLNTFSEDLLRRSAICVPTTTWWYVYILHLTQGSYVTNLWI